MTHITVRKAADGRAVLSQCRKSQLFYCPFCQPSIFKPRDYASVLTHIESHRLKAVLHREFTIFICHLECRAAKHFHCPYCPKTYVNRRDFTKHISQCEVIHRPSCNPDDNNATENAPGSTENAPGSTENAPGSTVRASEALYVSSGTVKGTDAFTIGPDDMGSTTVAPDETNATVKCPGSTSLNPDETNATVKWPVHTSVNPNETNATIKCPGSTSLNPDETNATVKCPGSTSLNPDETNATVKCPGSTSLNPDETNAAVKCPGSTSLNPDETNAAVKCPGSTSLNPDETNAAVQCPGSACPAVRSAVKQKIKCPNCSLWLNKNNLRKHQQRKHVSTDKDITSHPAVRPSVKRKTAPCGQLRKQACTGQDTVVSLDPKLMLQMDEPKRWRENPANTILDLMAPWLERLNSDQQFEVVRLLMGYVLELMDQFPGSSSSTSN